MKRLYFLSLIFCFGCNDLTTTTTHNKYRDAATIELKEIVGNLNCQSPFLKKDTNFYGKADRHYNTQFFFEEIIEDAIKFRYENVRTPPYESRSIDTGEITLKCTNFQSPPVDEVKKLVDSMLFANVNLSFWGDIDTIEALPNFTEKGRSFGKYTIQNNLEGILSTEEMNDLKYNGMHFSSPELNDLNLNFLDGKNVIWLDEHQAQDTGFYLKIYRPLFNTHKTLCFLQYDLACNRIEECSSGIHLVFKKEKGHWNRIYIDNWES